VHLAMGHSEDDDHDDDDSAVVHIHFYAVSIPASGNHVVRVDGSDGGHIARSLDTFTTIPQAGFLVVGLPASQLLIWPPAKPFVGVAEVTEPCGHDPPAIACSTPRAPPV
jgi:hypothetical protein